MQAFRHLFTLLILCCKNKEGKIGLFYFITIFLLSLCSIQVTLRLITWNKDFYNALERYDTQAVITQIGLFALLTAISALLYLTGNYLRKLLQIRWRKSLTEITLHSWLSKQAYWHLEHSQQAPIDNPDQRIAEDCRIFVEKLTTTALDVLSTTIGLFSYFVVLWNIANFALNIPFFSHTLTLSRYMVWAAPLYVFACSLLTHYLGAPLMPLKVKQQRREADFRFSLTRFRESASAIALEGGENVERQVFDRRFKLIMENWRQVINRELILGCFTRPYMSTILRIPVFLALPIYLIGQVSLGTLMQIGSAFQNVATNLSWFIFSYRDLAELIASSERLMRFLNATYPTKTVQTTIHKHFTADESIEHLTIHNLTLTTPEGNVLLTLAKLHIAQGQWVQLKGVSGIGKSTLLKTIAGLYPFYSGKIERPAHHCLFLPQKAYFPLGGLADAVAYPQCFNEKNKKEIKQILKLVGFREGNIDGHFTECDFNLFSGGEQQRIIIARILFNKPKWVFMDESTHALDDQSERDLLTLLRENLPQLSVILITHHAPQLDKLDKIINLA